MIKKIQKPGGNLLIWLVIIVLLTVLYHILSDVSMNSKKIPFSTFLESVDSSNISEVVIHGAVVDGRYTNGKSFTTLTPIYYPNLIDKLYSKGVKIDVLPTETSMGTFLGILLSWFPVLLFIGVWLYFMKSMQGGGRAMGFGRSKAKLVPDTKKVTFMDVAGVDEAKEELKEIVEFLRDPTRFQKLGATIPKGCLLIGAPGTGKTLLAKAIAGEANVPFFAISGSEFVEMFVGVGASRVRDMFERAKKNAPCIIFIDEIDALGRHRGAGWGGGNDEREQTLNQMLVEMDGFADNGGVIVIAATNRPDVLDKALLRPGRFDRLIYVQAPDIKSREQIISVHIKKILLDKDVNAEAISRIARGIPGFTGADIANLVNESALMAAKLNLESVTEHILELAKDKVIMGPERRSIAMNDDEKKLTAYHEAGHTVVTLHLPASDKLHKVTIIPRGRALGVTMRLPDNDRYSASFKKFLADLAVGMGGRAAEFIIFGEDNVTSGAMSDIKMVTNLAHQMVAKFGFSKLIGMVNVGPDKNEMYGYNAGSNDTSSDHLMENIDKEIKRMIDEAYNEAIKILEEHIDELHALAKALLVHETLNEEDVRRIISESKEMNKVASQMIDQVISITDTTTDTEIKSTNVESEEKTSIEEK